MTDQEYAASIYCQVFDVDDDGGDTNTQEVLAAILTLEERDRIVLEARFRHGKTYKEIGMKIGGVTKSRAAQITQRAIRRLFRKDTAKNMSKNNIVPQTRRTRERLEASKKC